MVCVERSELRPLRSRPWRVVEAQHVVATRKLVDTASEHELLEELIEGAKPSLGEGRQTGQWHYLLVAPFRYPPLRHGSRFATRRERGIWYGSESLPGAFSEVAYYRLRFLEDTQAELGQLAVELSALQAELRTDLGVDLTRVPFADDTAQISSPTSYRLSQLLGAQMRQAGAQAFRYLSARDPDGATNVGVFTPAAFASVRPGPLETWHCVASHAGVDFTKRDFFESWRLRFAREVFLVDGVLPRSRA